MNETPNPVSEAATTLLWQIEHAETLAQAVSAAKALKRLWLLAGETEVLP